MYESWFRFRRRPFSAAPRSEDYYPSEASERARKSIISCVQRGAGPALLAGGAGSGKTTSCQQFLSHFRTRVSAGLISCAGISSRRTFFQNILFELGRPYRDQDEGELRLSLVDHLTTLEKGRGGTVLIFDDAHELPLEQFEDLRMLSGLLRNSSQCVHLILSGSLRLEELLSTPQLESLNQRVAARCYLEPFQLHESEAYIRRQFERASAMADEVFIDGAFEAIYKCTGGTPRLINQLCDHALVLAAAGGHLQLDEHGIREAWSDLQHLPPPESAGQTQSYEDFVEFGDLEEEPIDTTVQRPPAKSDCGIPGESSDAQTEIEYALDFKDDDFNANDGDEDVSDAVLSRGAEQRLEDIIDHLDEYQRLPYPEIDLSEDPFAELFAEEEVVIRRPNSMLNHLADRQPEVYSEYGQDLISTLAQLASDVSDREDNSDAMSRYDASARWTKTGDGGQTVRSADVQLYADEAVRGGELVCDLEMSGQEVVSDVNWLSSPEPQEFLVKSESVVSGSNHADFRPASGKESQRRSTDGEQIVDHQESGSYQINVDCESPGADGEAVLAFMAHTAAIDRAADISAEASICIEEVDVEVSAIRSDSESDIVTLAIKLPTIEAITDVVAEVDFVDAVRKEPQEPAPAVVRVVELNEANRDQADPSKPRRRFKQLFSNLAER